MNRIDEYELELNKNYLLATNIQIMEGMSWYWEAHRNCQGHAEILKVPLYQFIAIVAALSPQKRWEKNIEDAVKYITSGGKAKLFATKVMKDKCKQILALDKNSLNTDKVNEILKGNKIKSFYENILRPYKDGKVTVDRHAMRSVNMQGTLTDKKYKEIESIHKKVSKQIGIKPHELQAIVWLVVR